MVLRCFPTLNSLTMMFCSPGLGTCGNESIPFRSGYEDRSVILSIIQVEEDSDLCRGIGQPAMSSIMGNLLIGLWSRFPPGKP